MKARSISRREFVRESAFWIGAAGVGAAGSRKAVAAMEAVASAAAGKDTDLIAGALAFVREEQVDFFGIGDMSEAYPTLETARKSKIPQESRLPRVIALAYTQTAALVQAMPAQGVPRGEPGDFLTPPPTRTRHPPFV